MTPPPPTRAARAPTTSWSLERRLQRRLLGWLTALWLAGALIAVIGVRIEINEVMDSALLENAQHLLALPDSGGVVVDDLSDHHEPVRFVLTDGDGHIFWRSQDAPPELRVSQLKPGFHTEHGNRLAVQFSRDRKRIAVAFESLEDRNEALWDVVRWQLIPLLVLLPLAGWTLTRVLRQGFASLNPLRRWLAQHDLARGQAGPAKPAPEHDVPRELAPLVHTLNDLLDRVTRLVAAEQAFAANSAHELRTPVAAARAQAQRLLEEAACQGNPGACERVQALLRQLDQLGHVCTKLLQLSRVHSGRGLTREPVELQTLVRLVGDEFRAPGISERLHFDAPAEPVWALADLDALGIALRNLIENALRHAPGAAVRVRVEPGCALIVEDDGPGLPLASDEAREHLTQPFARGGSGTEGHGLGLSIADSVMQQLGGRLELTSPTQTSPALGGHGFRATLHLQPARPAR
jgi:two-component system OmpR family sensor kinase